ncbi:MAG: peptidase T [Victivallales bacterium]|nr:peptidase T [Victivallales bacterium]
MNNLLKRFLKYVSFDTQSDDKSKTHPSTEKQRKLAEYLADELKGLGINDVVVSETSYVYAKIPATPGLEETEPLGLIAHMDTALEVSGANIHPQVIENWDGKTISLGSSGAVLQPSDAYQSKTIVTTDGTTLLGADDKAGIAIIVTAVSRLLESDIPHGPVCLAFTSDEEIGEGADNFDPAVFGARFAFTLDGGDVNLLETENFNAASADVSIHGKVFHPGGAYHRMVNALSLSMEFCRALPPEMVPEQTRGRDGFFYLNDMSGNSGLASMHFLIRDFDTAEFERKKQLMKDIACRMNGTYGDGTVVVTLKEQYQNMKRHLDNYPQIAEAARRAIASIGLVPKDSLIRGGTDGAHLAEKGVFCPNLGDGCHNAHGIYEYAVLEEMEQGVQIVLALIAEFVNMR